MDDQRRPDWHPLAWIDEYLRARGWTDDEIGWTPPAVLQNEIAIFAGRGRFRRAAAARIQIDIDERVFAA